MKPTKKYKTYVLVFFIVLVLVFLAIHKLLFCPQNYLLGIPCPLCGITRSFLALFRLDFKSAFYYHALWPIVLIFVPLYGYLKINKINVNKKLENTICIIIGIIFLSYFIIRHIYGSEIVSIHFYDSLIYKIYSLLFK
jgi:hypothetical protein